MTNTAPPPHRPSLVVSTLLLGLSFLSAPPANATGSEPEPTAEAGHSSNGESVAQEDHSSRGIELEITGVSDLEFEDSGGSIDLLSQGVEIELPWLSLSANVYDFSWESAEELSFSNGAAEPWDQLHRLEVRHDLHRPIRERWLLMASLGGGVAFEEEISDSGYLNAVVGAVWTRSEDWSFLFGVGYNWHSKVDVEFEVFPAIGISYRERAEHGWSASLGLPQTGVRYRFASGAAISLNAGAQSFVAKLAEDSEVASEGFAEFLRFDLGLYYEQTFGERFALKVGPTYGFAGELKIHNSEGELLSEHDLESSPGFSLKMGVKF